MAVEFLKSLIIKVLRRVFSFIFAKKLMKVVRIEGGLGSQLIGLVIYESKKIRDPLVRPDVSYFFHRSNHGISNGPTIWDWELDDYGYALENFSSQSKFYDKYLGLFFSSNTKKVRDSAKELAEAPWRALAKKLPLAGGVNDFLVKHELSLQKDFAVIHIRRGDYLKVASRVLTLEESINGLARFSSFISGPIFITSDDFLGKKELDYCKDKLGPSRLIVVDSGIDHHIVHSLMRSATFLFTSNSTFSWTAGMLNVREAPMIISPTSFFGEKDYLVNDLFRSRSSWMLLDLD
jgi:hypothetical protein